MLRRRRAGLGVRPFLVLADGLGAIRSYAGRSILAAIGLSIRSALAPGIHSGLTIARVADCPALPMCRAIRGISFPCFLILALAFGHVSLPRCLRGGPPCGMSKVDC